MPIHNISHNNTLASGLVLPWVPGRYYITPNGSTPIVTATLGIGVLRLYPILIPNAITITRACAEISAIGDVGSKLRLGLYADDGTGQPGALVADFGTIAGDSATYQEITGLSVSVGPGQYWTGGAVQLVTTTQPTVRATNVASQGIAPFGSTTPGVGQGTVGLSMNPVTGALPATFVNGGSIGAAPRVIFKT